MRLNLDNPREPFSPSGEPIPWRLITADDFSAAHLDTLLALIPEIMDSELRARIADILWYRRRGGYQIARLAVQSYLDSAQLLEDPRNWTQCFDRVERAIQLAVSLGKNNRLYLDLWYTPPPHEWRR